MELREEARKKKRVPWANEEVRELIRGVEEFGAGKWRKIWENYQFNSRSNEDLKDKWRNLLRKGNPRELRMRYLEGL